MIMQHVVHDSTNILLSMFSLTELRTRFVHYNVGYKVIKNQYYKECNKIEWNTYSINFFSNTKEII